MTNKERQIQLDKRKYLASELYQRDLSGEMSYCAYCSFRLDGKCTKSQYDKEALSLCAIAYNKMDKAKR